MSKKHLAVAGTVVLLLTILAYRILLGMSKFSSHDEFQVYLIGLQAFTTHTFPWFGPDVIYSQTQIPGGLQGLLIAGPIELFRIPEAPYFLLNLLSFAALLFFGWYLSKRITNIPGWFIYIWLLTCPWTLHYSTHIENPSYVLPAAILFFISIFELGGFYKKRIINPRLSFLFLGFSLFWVMQIHLSWALMPPYILWILVVNWKDRKLLLRGALFFVLGALLSVSTLIPTLLKGFYSGGAQNNMVMHISNVKEFLTILFRFLSFASYEIPRFIGNDMPSRLGYVTAQPWTIPLALILFPLGILQVGWFIISFFMKNSLEGWNRVRMFTLGTVLMICFSFLFSISKPGAHTFYLVFPVALWYSFYCYGFLFRYRIKWVVAIILAAGIAFQASFFFERFHTRSIFPYRDRVSKAIEGMDYTIAGLRRESKLVQMNREDLWKRSVSGDTVAFSTGFEITDPYFRLQNIVNSESHAGKFSCKTDSIQPFSASFVKRLSELGNPSGLRISFYAKSSQPGDFVVVYNIRSEPGNDWKCCELKGLIKPDGTWQPVQFTVALPANQPKDAVLEVYFWMNKKSGAVLYIDDIRLDCLMPVPLK
jgi:hypothetical protein